jgi:rsbT antagonist protein RsbS
MVWPELGAAFQGVGFGDRDGEHSMKDESLPIIQIRNCLLVSIQTELHDRLALGLQEALMERVRSADAKGVILDVSAVEVIDSYITRILNDIGKSVRFMGAECYIVGIRPAVAMTLIEMGVELDSVHTALNLDLALEKLELLQS